MDLAHTMKILSGKFSTAIQKITWPCKRQGRFVIVGSIPGTCYNVSARRSQDYATEEEALAAILADPWIVAHPEQVVQRADCSRVQR